MLQLHSKTAAAKEQPFKHQVMQTENTRISISISMSSCTAETHISMYAQRCVGIRFFCTCGLDSRTERRYVHMNTHT